MELVNNTPANAAMLRTSFGEDRILAAVVTRPTFRIVDGELQPTPDEPWPVSAAPLETPVGELPADVPFLTGGIDVFVVGNVRTRADAPRRQVDVEIRIPPTFRRSIAVFGDRRWVREGNELVPSEPEPFTEQSLGYDNAFGGSAALEGGGELAWSPNPGGKGFYLTVDEAEGQPLPNLEDPDELMSRFDDRPEPVGTAPYPSDGSLQKLNALDLHVDSEQPENSRLLQIKPLLFNQAHPKMVIEPGEGPRSGDLIEITNVRPEGDVRFAMPDLAYHVHVQLEDRSWIFPLHLDQIGILLDDLRVFLSYRVVFRYRLVKFERRRTTLHAGNAPDAVPEGYIEDWESAATPFDELLETNPLGRAKESV